MRYEFKRCEPGRPAAEDAAAMTESSTREDERFYAENNAENFAVSKRE